MITYSQQEMQKQLIADQRLWRKVSGPAAALLLPMEVALLGWSTGWWTGAVTVASVSALAVLVPPRLSINIYAIDLFERLLRLPLWLGWLLLLWHLTTREPIFPAFGVPAAGAAAVTASAWVLTYILAQATRMMALRVAAGRVSSGS